jgi:hypothetical protein
MANYAFSLNVVKESTGQPCEGYKSKPFLRKAVLVAIQGKDAGKQLLCIALEKRPSLIIDCANSADPYSIMAEEEWLSEVYVINAEAIYRFRDSLKKVKHIMEGLSLKVLVITPISALFSYDDPIEDNNVIRSCWQVIRELANEYEVFVAADKLSSHYADETWDTQYQAREGL